MSGRGDDFFRISEKLAASARILRENRARIAPKRKPTQRNADEEKTRENRNMSEKVTDKKIDDQAWVAWLEWHKDIPAHQIPMMPETFRKAFREGARWMETKGAK